MDNKISNINFQGHWIVTNKIKVNSANIDEAVKIFDNEFQHNSTNLYTGVSRDGLFFTTKSPKNKDSDEPKLIFDNFENVIENLNPEEIAQKVKKIYLCLLQESKFYANQSETISSLEKTRRSIKKYKNQIEIMKRNSNTDFYKHYEGYLELCKRSEKDKNAKIDKAIDKMSKNVDTIVDGDKDLEFISEYYKYFGSLIK